MEDSDWLCSVSCFCLHSIRIKEEPSAVVCPVIDVIDWDNFQYLGNPGEPQIGGFDWRLVFTWHTIPESEQKRRRSPTDVIRYELLFRMKRDGLSEACACRTAMMSSLLAAGLLLWLEDCSL